jgi:hypothetical protein
MLGALWSAIQSSAAAPTSIQVQIQPDKSAKILQIVLSIAVALLSVTTFLVGYRKRISERRASWYQKVVVDESLPRLFEFFKTAESGLLTAATDCEKYAVVDMKVLSSEVTAAIAKFSAQLINVQDFIAERLIVFDEKSTAAVGARFFKLQDDVAECFEGYVIKKRRDREDMRGILLVAQREVLKLLYDCEFKNF